jgi:2-amino-4-hydroxy-6-hydroxymethyldihydropteridine diphosphokinase
MSEIAFSLGSNLGDRLANLREARRRIFAAPDARPAAQSPVYETEPVGVKPEYRDLRFLNAVLAVESDRPAEDWLETAAAIEREMGRARTADRCAPRPIDIDILYAGGRVLDGARLTVPHPRWAERRFVVRPLADIRPDLVLPGGARTVAEVLAALPDPPESVRLFAREW